jgi:hypothetical protein
MIGFDKTVTLCIIDHMYKYLQRERIIKKEATKRIRFWNENVVWKDIYQEIGVWGFHTIINLYKWGHARNIFFKKRLYFYKKKTIKRTSDL